jgi:RHS repeat-associated protein
MAAVPVATTPTASTTPATTTYTYDGNGQRTSSTTGSTTAHYAFNQVAPTPLLLTDGTTDYIYTPGGTPIAQTTGGTTTYLWPDPQGYTRLLTQTPSGSTVAAVVGAYAYDPAGNTTTSIGAVTTPLQYTGAYQDLTTGLYYLNARYYDPTTNQFLSIDPLLAMTQQPYGYANENPTNGSDPSGDGFWDDVQNFAAGFGNTVTLGLTTSLSSAIAGALGRQLTVNTCSGWYTAGEIAGYAALTVTPAGDAGEGLEALEAANEGIYVIEGADGTYVGQSGDISARFFQHLLENGGRFTQEELDAAERIGVEGGRAAREIAEQQMIDDLGGVDNLLNIRNPIGPARFSLMPQPYMRP